ncbi:MAG TPA: TraR/DksA C4-type zinc finger protein, partial [Polyangiaceae bacterium]
MQRSCSECGEPISVKRLEAMPDAHECVECASQASGTGTVVAPPKRLDSKPITTTFHLKRYLANVGQKLDSRALFRTLVRVNYLFPHISAAEMTPIFIQWSKQTNSPFD